MHNGVVSDFSVIRRAMCARMSDQVHASILGSTDSEHVFALYMTNLTKGLPDDRSTWEREFTLQEMAAALHNAVATVVNLQQEFLGGKKTPNSLNLCVTDGKKLVAYRFRNHVTEEPPSLYYSTMAGTTLNRKYQDHPDGEKVLNDASRKPREQHGKHLIVASEPSTYRAEDWHLIEKNKLLMVDDDGGVTIANIPYDHKWDAVDPTADPGTAAKSQVL